MSPQATIKDVFTNQTRGADCTQKKRTYSPLCGRYSIYSGDYTSNCKEHLNYYNCKAHTECTCSSVGCAFCGVCHLVGACGCCSEYKCAKCTGWSKIPGTAPEPYEDSGTYTAPWFDDTTKLASNYFTRSCANTEGSPTGTCPEPDFGASSDKDSIISDNYQKKKYFWYSADTATGLLYRLDDSGSPAKASTGGGRFIKREDDQKPYDYYNKKYIIIKNVPQSVDLAKKYLQFSFYNGPNNSTDYSKNTGGYVLNIKHTKCVRTNGNSYVDSVKDGANWKNIDRGRVEYKVIPFNDDPKTTTVNPIGIQTKPDGTTTITSEEDGYLWMRILNGQEDYKDSVGRYKVQFFTSEKIGSFTLNVINPLFELLKNKIKTAAKTIFQNMTCYNGDPNSDYKISSCTNFFNYIKAILILYVMSYGMMFLLGMVKIKQDDLLIRIIKIAIVGGLMNGNTFEFFNQYIFDGITGFSDEIISHMSGYSLFSSSNKISNPFMFLDALMSKIFFSKTFMSQLLSLISMGLSGLIYFVIIFISLGIVIITVLRAIAVYIMAFMAIAVLIGLAPLFFTFMLFDVTRYLFDNWIRFTIRYMIEPVILMAGIIILTQLFTIFLDYATGYSVCWKCALPIKIPFPNIPVLKNFANVPLFCINWFAPWGMDYRTGMMGINMQHIITLVIIAYGMYGYVDFSGKMVVKLTNTAGPSATGLGQTMSSAIEQKVLKKAGIDDKGRQEIKGKAKARIKDRGKALDEAKEKRAKGKEGGDKPEEPPPSKE